jgi:hypothetical protein
MRFTNYEASRYGVISNLLLQILSKVQMFPQHSFLKHLQSVFFTYCERPKIHTLPNCK